MDLPAGSGAHTVLTSNKGRIVDVIFVLRRADHLLLLTGDGNETTVAEWIDFYTIIEDTEVEDVTPVTSSVSLMGPRSGRIACLTPPGLTQLPLRMNMRLTSSSTACKQPQYAAT